MALHSNPLVPLQPESPSDYEQKLEALRAAIAHGDASGLVDGDIFAQVAEELGLDLDEEDLDEEEAQ